MMITIYRVKAIGYGLGLGKHTLSFTITSNYDIDTHREDVMRKVRNALKQAWNTAYEIISVIKETP